MFLWGCIFREELSLGHSWLGGLLAPQRGWGACAQPGTETPQHDGPDTASSTFLAQEKGAVGAGGGPGPARSLLLLLRLLKHWAMGLKLGQLPRLLLQDETLS